MNNYKATLKTISIEIITSSCESTKIDYLTSRPLTDEEQRLNVPKVISCNEQKREVTVVQSIANKQIDRAFAFDKVQYCL